MTLLAALCLCQFALAQPETSFLGSITYKLKSPEKPTEKTEATVTIHFGPNKLYLQIKENGETKEDAILIDLDSGKLYTFMPQYKSYKVQKLATLAAPKKAEGPASVLGHPVEAVPLNGTPGTSSLLRILPMMGNLYVAKDLVFRVPQQFRSAPELMMVVNDHILLKAELDMGNWMGTPTIDGEEAEEQKQNVTFELEAIEIKAGVPDAGLFRIPAGYTLRKQNDYSYMVDSTTMMTDTTLAYIDSAVVSVDTVATTDFYPGQRAVPVEVISNEGKVIYDTVWLTTNKEYPTYGVDYKIVGRWVPKKKTNAATTPKTGVKSPARKPKKS